MRIPSPPQLSGDERRQLVQVRSYLYQMAEVLNQSLSALTPENFQGEWRQTLQSAATQQQMTETVGQSAAALKALIIKTAAQVQARMDAITATLEGEYLARSEFGEYQEQVSAEITATATGIVQAYDYDSRLSALDETMAGFEAYEASTRAYIKTGLLYYDEANVPVYGVAVGEQDADAQADGQTVVSSAGSLATFTADRLSFWQNGVETAWISDGQWCARAVEVKERITLGQWAMETQNGFTLRWVG